MATQKTFSLLLFILSIVSCSKEDFQPEEDGEKGYPPKQEQAVDYLPFEVGQYWIYEGTITQASTGQQTTISKTDSLYISRDTLINRHQYFLVEGTRLGEPVKWWLRPSGTELLDEANHLLFSMEQYFDTLTWPVSLLPEGVDKVQTVLKKEEAVTVPHGAYPAIVFDQIFHLSPNNNSYQGESIIYESIIFGKGVGPILFTRTLPELELLIEMELIRCSVN